MPSERLSLKDKITLISEWCLKHKNTLKHFPTGSFVKLCSTIGFHLTEKSQTVLFLTA